MYHPIWTVLCVRPLDVVGRISARRPRQAGQEPALPNAAWCVAIVHLEDHTVGVLQLRSAESEIASTTTTRLAYSGSE